MPESERHAHHESRLEGAARSAQVCLTLPLTTPLTTPSRTPLTAPLTTPPRMRLAPRLAVPTGLRAARVAPRCTEASPSQGASQGHARPTASALRRSTLASGGSLRSSALLSGRHSPLASMSELIHGAESMCVI